MKCNHKNLEAPLVAGSKEKIILDGEKVSAWFWVRCKDCLKHFKAWHITDNSKGKKN